MPLTQVGWATDARTSILATIDGVVHCVPDDPTNADRQLIQRWQDDGNAIGDPPRPPPAPVPESAPLWAVRAVLRERGLFAQIDAYVTGHQADNPVLWEAWNMGNEVARKGALVLQFAPQFNLSAADMDAIMVAAAALKG
jgi:hypothetical protein